MALIRKPLSAFITACGEPDQVRPKLPSRSPTAFNRTPTMRRWRDLRTAASGCFLPARILPPQRQLLGPKETFGQNFPLLNSDRQLLRMKRSFNRLEKCCHEGLKTADTVEKLCFEKSDDFIRVLSTVLYCRYEGGSQNNMKTRSGATRRREINFRLRAWCPKRFQGILSLLSLRVFQQYRA